MLTKLDPINIAKLQAYLSSDMTIVNCFANSPTSSTLVISQNDVESSIVITKQCLTNAFKLSSPSVNYVDKMSINDAIKAFSDNNKLGLVKGIDYKDDPSLVMKTGSKTIVSLVLLTSSPLYYGTVNINVFIPTSPTVTGVSLTNHANDIAKAIELSLNASFTPTASLFANDTLTVETMTSLRNVFKDSTIITSSVLDDIAGSTVLSYTLFEMNDKPFCLVLIVTPDNNLYYLKLERFNESDVPVLS